MNPWCVTIEMEATKQYFHVVVFVFQRIANGNFQKISKVSSFDLLLHEIIEIYCFCFV